MPQKVSEIGWPTYESVMKHYLIINHELRPKITEETELQEKKQKRLLKYQKNLAEIIDSSDHITPCAVDSMNLSYRHTVSILHELLFLDASLSSSRLIPVPTSISFIHISLDSPLLLLPSPHANIISFSRPYALITCSKIIIFCFVALCNNKKPPLISPISCTIASFVLLSVHAKLSILLQIHIFWRQSSFPLPLSLSMFHNRTEPLGRP